MKPLARFLGLVVGLMSFSILAATAVVPLFGPKTFYANPSGATYQQSFNSTVANADGVLTIINGDGKDYEVKDCANLPILRKLACFAIAAISNLTKPQQLEVSLNGKILIASKNLPEEIGKYQFPIKVQTANNLKVTVKGLWTESVTLDVKAQSQQQNQAPIARITATPNTGTAPELVTLSGIASSDPDGDAISGYTWDFADGSFATGSIVTHNFVSAGTYNVKLTVTDAKGASGSTTLPFVVKANQPPVASFLARIDTDLGVLKLHVDGTASKDADGSLTSTLFDFGDGKTADTLVADHVYEASGLYTVKLTVNDNKGGTHTVSQSVTVQDKVAPKITISRPTLGEVIQSQQIFVSGSSNEPLSSVSFQISGESEQSFSLNNETTFSGSLTASTTGPKALTVRAKDLAGNESVSSVNFVYDHSLPPIALLSLKSQNQGLAPFMALLDATASTDPQGQKLTYTFQFGDGSEVINDTGLATHTYENAGNYTAQVIVQNQSGLTANKSVQITVNALTLPPAPNAIAPAITQNNIVIPFEKSVSFIYEGENAIQKNVAQGIIDPTRVSIVRGQVVDENDDPVAGVKVTVLKGSALGYTYTRDDGFFDIAVNGGATTTVQYEKPGYLPAQRMVVVRYNDYSTAEKTALVKTDPKVTQVQNNAPTPQTVVGSEVSDEDGKRTATLVIPSSTKALVELPNGGTLELPSLSLRITEYTVGEKGPSRMPASLPTGTSYTYAVDITADEALAVNAKHIRFSKPVSFYTDNFLGFKTGTVVPVGSYDYDRGLWIPERNGRVLKVLNISNGKAILDTFGQNQPATATELSGLGIDDEELQKIAQIYSAGSTFWRAQATRFSPMDLNMLAGNNSLPPSNPIDSNNPNTAEGGSCKQGSIIDVLSQSLKEQVPIVGTNLSLLYSSARTSKADNIISIRLTASTIPSDLREVDLIIEVAGQKFSRTFQPSPSLRYDYEWNGLDIYGRKVEGRTKAKVTIGYKFPSSYLTPLLEYPSEFGMYPANLEDAFVPGREYGVISNTYDTYLGKAATSLGDIGGWTLPIYHYYNPQEKILYYGDGSIEGGINLNYNSGKPIEVLIGNGAPGFSPDGTVAKNGQVYNPHPVMYGSDRSIYFSDGYPMIRKINPNGVLETIAGTPQSGFSGDGGPAIDAQFGNGFNSIKLVEGEEREFYIADIGNFRIRKINKDGIITTIAGNGVKGSSGDGGPALQAQIGTIFHLAYYQGSVFIIDTNQHRIREITSTGLIRTVIGTGTAGFSPDGTPSAQTLISSPSGLGFNKNGELIFADNGNNLIRKINRLGRVETIAGSRTPGSSADGTPILQASLGGPLDLKVREDGTVFFRAGTDQIKYIATNGTLQTFAGAAQAGVSPAGSYARSPLYGIRQFDFTPEGELVAAEQLAQRIIKIANPLNTTSVNGTYRLPSKDGSELYYFNTDGLHTKTTYSTNDRIKYSFVYNSENLLIGIKDSYNNLIEITRDGNGRVESISSPYGQTTALKYNPDGFISQIVLPNADSYLISYNSSNLLNSFKKPNGAVSSMEYGADGRLIRDTNILGGFTALQSILNGNVKTVLATSAENIKSNDSIQINNTNTIVNKTTANGEQISTTSSDTDIRVASNTGQVVQAASKPDLRLRGPASIPFYRYTYQGTNLRQDVMSRNYDRLTGIFDYKTTDTYLVSGIPQKTVSFDSITNTEVEVTANGVTTTKEISPTGQILKLQTGTLTPTLFSYDQRGRLSQIKNGLRTTTVSYGDNGLPESITNPLGKTTAFEYDLKLRKTKEILPDGRTITFNYDANDNLISIAPPSRPSHDFGFDLLGSLLNYSPPELAGVSNPTTSYTYDLDRRLTSITRPDGKTAVYNYNLNGTIKSIGTARGLYNFSYDQTGRLIAAVSPDLVQTNTSYQGVLPYIEDITGPFTARVTNYYGFRLKLDGFGINNELHFIQYDDSERIVAIDNMQLTYNTNDLLSTQTLGSVSESRGYDEHGDLISLSQKFGSAAIGSMAFTRDDLGRTLSKTEAGTKTDYSYDSTGRLTEVRKNGAITSQYSYDDNGNRLSAFVNGETKIASYDIQDRLLTYGSKSYTYNANGDLESVINGAEIKTFTYDQFSNLNAAQVNGKSIQYLADSSNRRIAKKVNGSLVQGFIYRGQTQVIAEVDGSGTVRSVFLYGSRGHSPDYMVRSGVHYKIVHDQLGSIRKVINSSNGQTVQEMTYDEFGNVISDSNPGFQPFGFAGGIYDKDTGLVRFGARDYDPETGRLISKDPILFNGGDTNLYGYVANDPVNWADPSGLARCSYSISTGRLSCTSNDGSSTSSANMFSGNNDPGSTGYKGGPIPMGKYDITKSPGANGRDWFLDPGLMSRIGYRLGQNRGGFNLHLRKGGSDGCITGARGESDNNFSNINNILNQDAGSNTIEVGF